MEFNFVQSSTVEVNDRKIHYDLVEIEDFINRKIVGQDFGTSVDDFHLGYEIADSTGHMKHYTQTANLRRYGRKYLLIVKQFDFNELKHMDAKEQFQVLRSKILEAILDISKLNRKPKDFLQQKFYASIETSLREYENKHFS